MHIDQSLIKRATFELYNEKGSKSGELIKVYKLNETIAYLSRCSYDNEYRFRPERDTTWSPEAMKFILKSINIFNKKYFSGVN